MGMAKRKAHIQGYAATGGQMEESKMEAFEPPEAGKAPAGVKKILKEVYNGCRADWAAAHPADRENAGNKESCSRIAWHAVKQAGWREEGGVWRKEHVSMDGFFTTLGDTARVRMEGRKGVVRQSAEAVLRAYHRRLVSEGDPEDGGYYAPHYGRPGERGGSLPRDSGGGKSGAGPKSLRKGYSSSYLRDRAARKKGGLVGTINGKQVIKTNRGTLVILGKPGSGTDIEIGTSGYQISHTATPGGRYGITGSPEDFAKEHPGLPADYVQKHQKNWSKEIAVMKTTDSGYKLKDKLTPKESKGLVIPKEWHGKSLPKQWRGLPGKDLNKLLSSSARNIGKYGTSWLQKKAPVPKSVLRDKTGGRGPVVLRGLKTVSGQGGKKVFGSFKMYNKYGKYTKSKTPTDLGYD